MTLRRAIVVEDRSLLGLGSRWRGRRDICGNLKGEIGQDRIFFLSRGEAAWSILRHSSREE